jgi:hypothetical protein
MSEMQQRPSIFRVVLLAFVMLGGAADTVRANAPPVISAATGIPIADSFSGQGFIRYWRSFANRTDHVVLVVLLVMASALFIITRGKWLK